MTRRSSLGVASALLVAAACAPAAPPEVAVTCNELAAPAGLPPRPITPADTIDIIVRLDSVPSGPGSVRVRVDPLAESQLARLGSSPPTAVGAGMALVPSGRFVGCASDAPPAIELRGSAAPLRKAWVMVASNRTVRVTLDVAERTAPQAVVAPGASGVVEWEG